MMENDSSNLPETPSGSDPSPETPAPAMPAPPAPSPNVVQKMFGVLFSPQPTFEAVNQKPSWFIPYLVYVLLAFVYFAVIINMMGVSRFLKASLGPNPSEQQVFQMEQAAKLFEEKPAMKATLYIAPVLGAIVPLIIAGILLLVVTLAGGSTAFKKAFSVTVNISFATTLVMSIFVLGPLLLTKDIDKFDFQNPVASNLGFFLDPVEMNKFFYSLASSIDLLSFWAIFLYATGFTAISTNLKKRTTYTCIISLWVVFVLAKSGLALLRR
jgi:hypothetical protein